MARTLSVSTAAFDGYDLPTAFGEIAALGVRHVEPAFIQGYTEDFTEAIFDADNARTVRRQLEDAGLECLAFSAHMDLAGPAAVSVFAKRMRFAAGIGAKIIITNAAPSSKRDVFLSHIESLAPVAAELDLTIALENPGDGSDNLLDTARMAGALIDELANPRIRLNFDPGNLPSHRPEADPIAAGLEAMPFCAHMHIKDVRRDAEGYWFTEINQGLIDYAPIFDKLRADFPELPVSLEMPLRVHRAPDASPRRDKEPVPLAEIRGVLGKSLEIVRKADAPGGRR